MTSKTATRNARTEKKCHVCELHSLSEKQYFEHCWSLMHHLKCEQQLKGTKHICNLCKTSCKSVKEYGQHLSNDVHSSARDKFYHALEKGKTIEHLIKSKVIMKPDISVPVKHCESRGSNSKKTERDNNNGSGHQRSENFHSFSNYTNFSWQPAQFNQPRYDDYNYYGNSSQCSNYFGPNRYQNVPWNANNGQYGNAWNNPYNGNWQSFNYHMNTFRPEEYGNNQRQFRYENRKFDKWHSEEHCAKSCKEFAKDASVKMDAIQHCNAKSPSKSFCKDTLQNVTNKTNHAKHKRSSSVTADSFEKDSESKSDVSSKVSEKCKLSEQSADKVVPSNSLKDCKTPVRKAKFPTKNSTPTVDGLSPPKTPQSQTDLFASDISMEFVNKLVNQSCSRKYRLLLENFMNKHGRTQSVGDSRLEQNLITLVKEAVAVDVVETLSSANITNSPTSDSLQKVKLSKLPDEILEQIMELLKLGKADLPNSDSECINTPNEEVNKRKVSGNFKEEVSTIDDEVKVVDLVSDAASASFKSNHQTLPQTCLQPNDDNDQNFADLQNGKAKKKNAVGIKLKQKRLKKVNTSSNGNSNSVGDLVETLQLLSSKLEAGISKLDNKNIGLSEKSGIFIDLVQSPDPKPDSKVKLKGTKKKKKLRIPSHPKKFEGIDSISKTKESSACLQSEQCVELSKNPVVFGGDVSVAGLKNPELIASHASKEEPSEHCDIPDPAIQNVDVSVKLEDGDPISEHASLTGLTSDSQCIATNVSEQIPVEIKTEALNPELTETAAAIENSNVSGSKYAIKQEVVEEIICEGEQILKENERVLAAQHKGTADSLNSLPVQSVANTHREDILRSSDSPTIVSLGASSIAVQALDYAIEEESLETQIQLLQKQIAKLQQAIFKLEEKKQSVQLERSKIMLSLKATVEGRKQAASLNRIISELPTNPFQIDDDTSIAFNQIGDRSISSSTEVMQSENALVIPSPTPNICHSVPINSRTGSLENSLQSSVDKSGCLSSDALPHCKGMKRKKSKNSNNSDELLPSKKCKKKEILKLETVSTDIPVTQSKSSLKNKLDKKKKKKTTSTTSVKLPHSLAKVETKTTLNFFGHVDGVAQLTLNKGKLYSCSKDGTVRRFKIKANSAEQKCLATFTHQSVKVIAMEVVTSVGDDVDDCVITASSDGVLKKFELLSGECVGLINCEESIRCIISHWSYLFVGFASGSATRYGLKKLKVLNTYICSNFPVTCMTTTIEGAYRLLCTGSEDKAVTVREANSGLLIRYYSLEWDYPEKISIVNGISYTLGFNKRHCRSVYVHHFLTGELLNEIKYMTNITSMCISNDQMLLLLGGPDGLIRVVDLKTQKQKQLYYGSGCKTVTSLCVSKKLLISGNEDGKIEAFKILLNQTYICKFGKCPAKFGYYEDVAHHVECIHANSRPVQCMATNCGILFSNPENVKEIASHIMTHVQQMTQDQ